MYCIAISPKNSSDKVQNMLEWLFEDWVHFAKI